MRFPIQADVAGLTHANEDGSSRHLIASSCQKGERLTLIRDYGNSFSQTAIKVMRFNGRQLGFVPDALSVRLAPLIDGGMTLGATIERIIGSTRGGQLAVSISIHEAEFSPTAAVGVEVVPQYDDDPRPPTDNPVPTMTYLEQAARFKIETIGPLRQKTITSILEPLGFVCHGNWTKQLDNGDWLGAKSFLRGGEIYILIYNQTQLSEWRRGWKRYLNADDPTYKAE